MANGERRVGTGGRRNSDLKRIRITAVLDASYLQSGDTCVSVGGRDIEAPSVFGSDLNQHHMTHLAVSAEGSITPTGH